MYLLSMMNYEREIWLAKRDVEAKTKVGKVDIQDFLIPVELQPSM